MRRHEIGKSQGTKLLHRVADSVGDKVLEKIRRLKRTAHYLVVGPLTVEVAGDETADEAMLCTLRIRLCFHQSLWYGV